MQLLEFQPIMKRIRWGGRKLGTRLKKTIGDHDDYAESWEIADHGKDQSVVLDGPFMGQTLQQLVQERGDELFGIHAGLDQFPLLIKFLDATDRLSLQVHPNDEQARQFDPMENGKTEAWVILESDPQSLLYAGLKPGIDQTALRQHLEAGTVEGCLHSFSVHPGDCIFIPAGTVHAIGAGILLAEVQQSSDLTFRLFDWGRLGTDGKSRPLHIDDSMQCIDFQRGPVDPIVTRSIPTEGGSVEELVRSNYFVIRRHGYTEPFYIHSDNRFRILMVIEGRAEFIGGSERRIAECGKTFLMPATASDLRIVPDGELVLLETFLPDVEAN